MMGRENSGWKWAFTSTLLFAGGASWSTSPSSSFVTQAEAATESSSALPTEPAFPRYTLEPLNFSVSHRQDVCDRNEAFQNGTVRLEDALRGLALRPYFLAGLEGLSPVDPDGTVPANSRDPSIRILDEVAQRGGFTWRTSFGASNINRTVQVNGQRPTSFDPMLAWAIQSFDLVGMEVVKTLDRAASGSSFVEGHIDSSIIMVGMSASEQPSLSMFSFLAPFTWQVWLMTLLTILLAGGVYQWMEWINGESDRQQLGDKPTETIFFAALSFNGDIKFEPSTDYARIFVLTLAFWGMILSSAYTANLASFLVAKNTPALQVETVGDAVFANLPMCVLLGTAMESEVRKAYPRANLILIDPRSEYDIYSEVLRGRCTLAVTTLWEWDKTRVDGTSNIDCQLQWIGRVFRFSKSSFATFSDSGNLCSNLIRDVLSLHISRLLDDGTIQEILDEYLSSLQTIECRAAGGESLDSGESDDSDGSGDDIQSLSLQDMGGLFIVVYISGALCCIAALVLWYRKKRGWLKGYGSRRENGEVKTSVSSKIGEIKEVGAPGGERHLDACASATSSNQSCIEVCRRGIDSKDGAGGQRDQLVSRLDVMRRDLEEMRSLLLQNDK